MSHLLDKVDQENQQLRNLYNIFIEYKVEIYILVVKIPIK